MIASVLTLSPHLRPRADWTEGDKKRGLVTGGKYHPPALDPKDLCRGEVYDHSNLSAHKVFGGVELRDPADHLAFLATDVEDEFVEFL
jgi:hypothetical protein